MHPADELADLRVQIRALKAREALLQARYISGQAPLSSNSHTVQVRDQPRRVFLRHRLPEHVLNDPYYWEERVGPIVVVLNKTTPVETTSCIDPDVAEPRRASAGRP